MITHSEAADRFSYDSDTGLISMKISIGSRKTGDVVGSLHHSKRLTVSIGRKQYQLARLAWLLHYGSYPEGLVDHINHDATDNRIENLREVTSKENSRNQSARINNKTGITGVHWCRKNKRWSATGYANGIRTTLGMFSTIFDAAACRRSNEISEGFHENHGRDTP